MDLAKKLSGFFLAHILVITTNLLSLDKPGEGDSHMKQTGMLVGNFEFNP